jgi:hypothetical protein
VSPPLDAGSAWLLAAVAGGVLLLYSLSRIISLQKRVRDLEARPPVDDIVMRGMIRVQVTEMVRDLEQALARARPLAQRHAVVPESAAPAPSLRAGLAAPAPAPTVKGAAPPPAVTAQPPALDAELQPATVEMAAESTEVPQQEAETSTSAATRAKRKPALKKKTSAAVVELE